MDASWLTNQHSTMGCVIKDEAKHIVAQFTDVYHAQSSIQAKTIAIYKAIRWASTRGIYHILIQSDCLSAVLQSRGQLKKVYQLQLLIEEIYALLS